MSARHPASDVFPAAAAGLAILALGGLLLLIGGGVAVGNPSEFDTWLVGVGLVVFLGAMLVVLIRSNPPPANPPKPTTHPASPAAAAGSPVTSSPPDPPRPRPPETSVPPTSDAPPRVAPAQAEPPTRLPYGGSTSIPAQYESVRQRVPLTSETAVLWDDGESAGVLLPFLAAGPQAARLNPDSLDPPEMTLVPPPPDDLAQEVARLRERVVALQSSDRPTAPAPPAALRAPTIASRGDGPRPPEPPTLQGVGARRTCVSCGSGLPGGATDPLCWGCGRPLCSTCYWRATEGAAAHTCPSCFARTGATSVSGGRGPAASGPTPVAPSARTKAATARR